MPRTILYYPTINIPDESWLKKTILYWDYVSSIVPDEDYYRRDIVNMNEDMRYLIDNGIYRPTFPSELFTSSNFDRFNEELERTFISRSSKNFYGDNRAYIHRKKLQHGIEREPIDYVHKKKFAFPDLAAKVHSRKFNNKIYEFFMEQGLIVDYDDEWLAMDSELCIQYMSLMAKYLADLAVNPTVVGTDKTKYLHYAYKKTFRSKKSLALYICFQDVLPQPAPDASLKKIIKFKDKRQTELSEFQYQLLQFENQLSHSTSTDEAKDQIELFKKQLEKSILEIEKIYKDEKINYTFGTINTFVDALGITGSISSIASLVAMAASLPTWAIISTIGTGAALGIGYTFLQHKMTANHERLTNDFAYLYDLYQNKIIL